MLYPNAETFATLAAEFDIVPVYKEILADMETPVSVLMRFAGDENVFLFESVVGGETWGRYSFLGIEPELMLELDHSEAGRGGLEKLRSIYAGRTVAEFPELPRFFGGAVGFLGYESMSVFERMPRPKAAAGSIRPVSRFMRVDQMIVFDNVNHTLKIVVCTHRGEAGGAEEAYRRAAARIARIEDVLRRPVAVEAPAVSAPVAFASNVTPDAFREAVRRAKDYIVAGDIIQVVLSQRFRADCAIAPMQLYRALRLLNPSPYTFFLKIGRQTLVGSSPEVMVRLTGQRVELRPIAGTRPRGLTAEQDRVLEQELLADAKEIAEHVMLVDLGRNDLGRIAETGTVVVTDYKVIERYSHVMHMVSHVEGRLRAGLDALDVVAATFPAGTLTGAPKIRAMQIIHELEPCPRGAYGGALGYISYNGNMDLAITIRTLDIQDGTVSVQAGAGIVYDSDPQKEFEETCHKARGMRRAVALAARGLELHADEAL